MCPQPNHAYRQKDLHLLQHALDALRQTTGIAGELLIAEPPTANHGARPDAMIAIELAGTRIHYAVEIKHVDRFAAIGQIKATLDQLPAPGLLLTPRLTAELADKCRELGVQFIDTCGNAFLQAPGAFVLVKGQRTDTHAGTTGAVVAKPRGGTATALRIIFALICKPALLNAPYREITQAANVALGAIGWTFTDLNTRGYITGGKAKDGRRILEHKRLIDEWVMQYPIKLRPKLHPRRFHATNPEWWKNIDITQYDAQWGGEVAADKLTRHLRPNTVTLYMQPHTMQQNITKLVVQNKLRADPNGEIEILEAFWNFPAETTLPDTVPPLLIYADLLATLDPRNFEIAQMIYAQHLRTSDTTD